MPIQMLPDHDDRHDHTSISPFVNHEYKFISQANPPRTQAASTSRRLELRLLRLESFEDINLPAMQNAPPAYILQNTVSHARHLPTSSAHAFTYPTLALLLSLSALESHELDLGHGRLFGYSDADSSFLGHRVRVTGIRPEAYLHDYPADYQERRKTIREKLEDVLKRFGHDPNDLEDAWMLTMPSYLGVEGINPLTVFYCYKKSESFDIAQAQLWIVVLEVHNTFGERHVYVLPTGSQHEDEITATGFTHSWTFPRQFHVSPFNDRSGYYTCSIVAPTRPTPSVPSPPLSTLSESPLKHAPESKPSLPTIRIQLYTPSKQLKLTAILRPTSVNPLTAGDLLPALARYPATLLLSFPRIAWQAFHLHYHRYLDVFARPEPRAIDPAQEDLFTDTELGSGDVGSYGMEKEKIMCNEVQRDGSELGLGGGVGWQPEGVLERHARRRLEQFLEARAWETGIRIHLVSTNPFVRTVVFSPSGTISTLSMDHGENERQLILTTRSARAFLLILSSPSPAHALLLTWDAERLLVVSDEKLFFKVFSLPPHTDQHKLEFGVRGALQWLRLLPIPHSLHHVPAAEAMNEKGLEIPAVNPLDRPLAHCITLAKPSHLHEFATNTRALLVLTAFLALTYFEKAVFTLVHARFVRGTEPWGGWTRAEVIWKARTREVGSKLIGKMQSD